ncbi:hypothetical protein FQR65_LT11056 [Abscondita terminalis]|nr:hypothetical protein FQR65_LT11056 [Abscondita terminalis]
MNQNKEEFEFTTQEEDIPVPKNEKHKKKKEEQKRRTGRKRREKKRETEKEQKRSDTKQTTMQEELIVFGRRDSISRTPPRRAENIDERRTKHIQIVKEESEKKRENNEETDWSIVLRFLQNMQKASRLFSQAPARTLIKSVYISQSNDIYTNLALEDWFYTHREFHDHNILMMWSNNPCIVVGRYQNPWLEANVAELPYMLPHGVRLARRKSGGGTVYQDRGNLNLTFFTSKKQYNRKNNLELIARAVLKNYGVNITVNNRDDLMIGDCKISGTAAKLGRLNAYHHCTLLVHADQSNLSRALRKPCFGTVIKNKASMSTRSKVMNLCEAIPGVTVNDLLCAIGREYSNSNSFRYINPGDDCFGKLSASSDELQTWEWCYGNCPEFTVAKSFSVPSQLCNGIVGVELNVTIAVEKGVVVDIDLQDNYGLFKTDKVHVERFKNCRFTTDAFDSIVDWLFEDKIQFVKEC